MTTPPRRLALILAISPILCAAATATADERCTGDANATTLAIEECLQHALDQDGATLDRYLDAVRREHAERQELLDAIEAAQTAWSSFVDADCGAVYERWSEGTIRGPLTLECRIAHTRRRTRDLWSDFLLPDAELPDPESTGNVQGAER